jgi:hypothetical protein
MKTAAQTAVVPGTRLSGDAALVKADASNVAKNASPDMDLALRYHVTA